MKKSALTKFRRILRRHGLEIELAKAGHYHVTKEGQYIIAVSATGEMNALKQAVRQLVSMEHLPEAERQQNLS